MTPEQAAALLPPNFAGKWEVDPESGCWTWTAAKVRGYGQAWDATTKQMRIAHRMSWESLVGPIAGGGELDHQCRNRSCIRPDHLRIVTRSENCRYRARRSDNTSGVPGVSWHKGNRKWVAKVVVTRSGKTETLASRCFVDLSEAAAWVARERARFFGEFTYEATRKAVTK